MSAGTRRQDDWNTRRTIATLEEGVALGYFGLRGQLPFSPRASSTPSGSGRLAEMFNLLPSWAREELNESFDSLLLRVGDEKDVKGTLSFLTETQGRKLVDLLIDLSEWDIPQGTSPPSSSSLEGRTPESAPSENSETSSTPPEGDDAA